MGRTRIHKTEIKKRVDLLTVDEGVELDDENNHSMHHDIVDFDEKRYESVNQEKGILGDNGLRAIPLYAAPRS